MKRIVLIFFLLVATLATHAQVQEFQLAPPSNSIVRSVGKDSVLVYTEVSPTEAYFLLYKDGDIMAQAFQLLPGEYVQVRDVRIHDGKTAYFCGTKLTGSFAVVGRFDINDVFSGTGSVEWGYFQSVPYSSTLLLTDMTRLDLFEYQDTVRMAMVGKTVYDWGVTQLPGTTVASAWFDGSNWQLRVHPNRYLQMKFTDVACLETTILAVGTTEEDTGCFVKPFRKVPDFPDHPVITNVSQGLIYRSPIGEVLVDQVAHDSAVVAHYDNSSGACVVFHLLEMGPTGEPLGLVKTWMAPPLLSSTYSTAQKLKELNSVGDTAYLLHTNSYPASSYPLLTDWLLALGYSNFPPSSGYAAYTPLGLWRPLYGSIHSMDASEAQMRLSGAEGTQPIAYGPYYPEKTPCYDTNKLLIKYIHAGIYTKSIVDEMGISTKQSNSYMPEIFTIDIITICNLKGKENER